LFVLTAIVFISLDKRLGCLDGDLATDSENQKMIHCVETIFNCLNMMETQIPVWKYVSTPTWRKYVKAADMFTEYV
jgi:hypothetical protein